jgi:hypothetical protein
MEPDTAPAGGFPSKSTLPVESTHEAGDKPAMPPAVVLVQAPADQRALKEALYSILYERFADQVTAKELIERLNGDQA